MAEKTHKVDVKIQWYDDTLVSMEFSQTAEYALRAAVWLGTQPRKPSTTKEAAQATGVPAGYLCKVLQLLGRAKLVSSKRGLHGGYMLARPADQISVLDVINAVDPIQHIRRCPFGLESHQRQLCGLHARLNDAIALIERVFAKSTIADLMVGTDFTDALVKRNGGHEVDSGMPRATQTPA